MAARPAVIGPHGPLPPDICPGVPMASVRFGPKTVWVEPEASATVCYRDIDTIDRLEVIALHHGMTSLTVETVHTGKVYPIGIDFVRYSTWAAINESKGDLVLRSSAPAPSRGPCAPTGEGLMDIPLGTMYLFVVANDGEITVYTNPFTWSELLQMAMRYRIKTPILTVTLATGLVCYIGMNTPPTIETFEMVKQHRGKCVLQCMSGDIC